MYSTYSPPPSTKMIPFLVSTHLFHIPESAILSYPYSKLADLAATSLPDDVATLDLPADSFSILTTYLATKTLPPTTLHPKSLPGVFETLGIPFPGIGENQHEASLGRGSLRTWERHNLGSRGREEYEDEVRAGLDKLEGGLFTSRRIDSFPAVAESSSSSRTAGAGGGLPSYNELEHTASVPTEKPAGVQEGGGVSGVTTKCIVAMDLMSRRKPRLVVLIPADTHSLRAFEKPVWAAEADEKVSSYVDVTDEQKAIVRLARPWTGEELEEGIGEIWEGISEVFGENYIVRVAMEEVTIRQCNTMGLYESVSGEAVVAWVLPK